MPLLSSDWNEKKAYSAFLRQREPNPKEDRSADTHNLWFETLSFSLWEKSRLLWKTNGFLTGNDEIVDGHDPGLQVGLRWIFYSDICLNSETTT